MSRKNALSRRSLCLCCLGAAAGRWFSPREAYAEARGLVTLIKDSAASSPIVTHKLRDNIYALEGSGGTVAALSGKEGKVLIDAGIAVSRPQMTKALDAIGPEPINLLINTHWHFDHTDGNPWLNAAGATIIAHENTRKYLAQVQRVSDWDYNFLALAPAGLPSEVFGQERTLKRNGMTIEMKHFGPAHTDSDISVRFSEANVIHVADTFWNGVYPFIDYSTGGSIDGMIAATDVNLAAIDRETIVIAGHGKAVGTKAELQEYRTMLVTVRETVARLKRQGLSRDEIVSARPTAAFDDGFGHFVIDPAFFTRLVFEGV